MQRPLSPVFGRTLPSEMVAAGVGMQRGHKTKARSPAAIGDPIDDSAEGVDGPTAPDASLKIAEKINRQIEGLEKSIETSLKKVKNLQRYLYPTMSDNPESRQAVSQMLGGFNKKIGALCDQLRTLNFDEDGISSESRANRHPHVRSDVSPGRPMRRLCSSPVRTLQTWRL